jgi:hypothetical protein
MVPGLLFFPSIDTGALTDRVKVSGTLPWNDNTLFYPEKQVGGTAPVPGTGVITKPAELINGMIRREIIAELVRREMQIVATP